MSELDPFVFEGAAAVLTGAGSGIGRSVAHALAARGVSVVVSDIDEARAAAVSVELNESGGRAVAQRCDVSDMSQIAALRDRCLSEFGRVDIVHNNVGIMAGGRPEVIPVAAWERLLDVNVLGIVRSNEVFLPLLLEQRRGHIVNTASASGLLNYAYDRAPYAITKAAVLMLSENLFLYLRQYGVGVSCLCPTGVMTNIMEHHTVFGDPLPLRVPAHAMVAADVAGERVALGIERRQFLIVTADTVYDEFARKGADLDRYLREVEHAMHNDTASGAEQK